MTVETFMIILTGCSTVSSLITEAIKKAVGDNTGKYKIPWNVVVLMISMFVGLVTMAVYNGVMGVPVTAINVIYMILMGVANWVCAMLGYDKVKQAIDQLSK